MLGLGNRAGVGVKVRVRVRVSKTVARRQRPAWRRAVRVAHAHEAHGPGRLRPGLLQRFQRQCSRLLPRAEHLLVQAGACSAARAEAATAVGRAVEREEVQEVNGLRLPSTRASARVCGCWPASASARATWLQRTPRRRKASAQYERQHGAELELSEAARLDSTVATHGVMYD